MVSLLANSCLFTIHVTIKLQVRHLKNELKVAIELCKAEASCRLSVIILCRFITMNDPLHIHCYCKNINNNPFHESVDRTTSGLFSQDDSHI